MIYLEPYKIPDKGIIKIIHWMYKTNHVHLAFGDDVRQGEFVILGDKTYDASTYNPIIGSEFFRIGIVTDGFADNLNICRVDWGNGILNSYRKSELINIKNADIVVLIGGVDETQKDFNLRNLKLNKKYDKE